MPTASARLRVIEPTLRSAGAATCAGALLGLLVGGVGGRLAMRLLLLTSNDGVRGIESDDGFVIGRVTLGGTLALLAVTTVIGAIGGLVYLAVRRWLVGGTALRSATCALGAAFVVGSMLVHADGVDFTLLSPVALAIGLFVAVPALFGALVVPLTERFDRDRGWFHSGSLRRAAAPLAVWLVPFLLVVALPLVAVAAFAATTTRAAVVLAGRVALVAIAAVGLAALVNDVAAIT